MKILKKALIALLSGGIASTSVFTVAGCHQEKPKKWVGLISFGYWTPPKHNWTYQDYIEFGDDDDGFHKRKKYIETENPPTQNTD